MKSRMYLITSTGKMSIQEAMAKLETNESLVNELINTVKSQQQYIERCNQIIAQHEKTINEMKKINSDLTNRLSEVRCEPLFPSEHFTGGVFRWI